MFFQNADKLLLSNLSDSVSSESSLLSTKKVDREKKPKKKVILVADDSPFNLEALKINLSNLNL